MLSICKFTFFEDDSLSAFSIGDEAIVDDYINDPVHSATNDMQKYDEQKEELRNNSGNIYGKYGGFALPPGEHLTFDVPELRRHGPLPNENQYGIMDRIAFPEYRKNTGNELVDDLPKYYDVHGPMKSLRVVGDNGIDIAKRNILSRVVSWY